MEKLKEQSDSRHAGLDGVVALAEKAAGTIERLQAENQALARRIHALEAAMVAETETLLRRIGDLEAACAAQADDARRYRWLRERFAGSAFFRHIERGYRNEQQADAEAGVTVLAHRAERG